MDTAQIVIITILLIIGVVTLGSLFKRMTELQDNLWVEPVILAVVSLFIYLIAR